MDRNVVNILVVFSGNTSSDDLEKFLKVGNGPEEEEEEEEEVTATMATIQENTERDVVFDTASPPVFLVRTTRSLLITSQ